MFTADPVAGVALTLLPAGQRSDDTDLPKTSDIGKCEGDNTGVKRGPAYSKSPCCRLHQCTPRTLYPPYKPYEGLSFTNQISRKLGVFDRKLEGSHSIKYYHFDVSQTEMTQQCKRVTLIN